MFLVRFWGWEKGWREVNLDSLDNTIQLAITAVHKWDQGTIRVSCACIIAALALRAHAAKMNKWMSSFERCLGLVIPYAEKDALEAAKFLY